MSIIYISKSKWQRYIVQRCARLKIAWFSKSIAFGIMGWGTWLDQIFLDWDAAKHVGIFRCDCVYVRAAVRASVSAPVCIYVTVCLRIPRAPPPPSSFRCQIIGFTTMAAIGFYHKLIHCIKPLLRCLRHTVFFSFSTIQKRFFWISKG